MGDSKSSKNNERKSQFFSNMCTKHFRSLSFSSIIYLHVLIFYDAIQIYKNYQVKAYPLIQAYNVVSCLGHTFKAQIVRSTSTCNAVTLISNYQKLGFENLVFRSCSTSILLLIIVRLDSFARRMLGLSRGREKVELFSFPRRVSKIMQRKW